MGEPDYSYSTQGSAVSDVIAAIVVYNEEWWDISSYADF